MSVWVWVYVAIGAVLAGRVAVRAREVLAKSMAGITSSDVGFLRLVLRASVAGVLLYMLAVLVAWPLVYAYRGVRKLARRRSVDEGFRVQIERSDSPAMLLEQEEDAWDVIAAHPELGKPGAVPALVMAAWIFHLKEGRELLATDAGARDSFIENVARVTSISIPRGVALEQLIASRVAALRARREHVVERLQ